MATVHHAPEHTNVLEVHVYTYTCTDMYDASDGCVHVPGQSWIRPEPRHHKQNDGDDGIQSH